MRAIPSPERPVVRLFAAAVAAAAIFALTFPGGAFADTEKKLEDARGRLQSLEDQLQQDRDAADAMLTQLAALQTTVEDAQARYQELEVLLDQTKNGVDAARAEYQDVQDQLGEIMAEAYMGGTSNMLGFVMDAQSQTDLADRLDFLSAIAQSNENLAERATQLQTDLQDRSAEIQKLLQDKQEVLQALTEQRASLKEATLQREEAVAQLEKTKNNLVNLMLQWRKQLKAEDIASLQHAFQGAKSLPYGDWANLFVSEIGAPDCKDNLVALVAWQLNEGTDADWNPLATTYYMPGSTSFNSYSVRNYASLADGLNATRLTLQKGAASYLYQPVLANLRRCSPAKKTAEAINASAWCRGCTYGRYVTGLIDRVAANYSAYAKL